MAQSTTIDAVVLDVNPPGMSGFEAMAHLKQDRRTADVPMIDLSARATDGDIDCASRLGFYRYLTKPVDVPALLPTLHSVLEPAHTH